MENLIKLVGSNIRVIRKGRGLSQEELAFKANLHPTYIGQVERGEKNITIVSLSTIIKALGITLEEFFSFVELNNSNKNMSNNNSVPYRSLIKVLQDLNEKDQEKILKIIDALVEWKKD
ncbi:helix-turn-helix transcriptional regulator [Bacillus wiedmannii]|uniref:helix-turn-helix domain-containing protein n=1 Tax=Bacillus wiedmannii TaxID=1890302 RepID=UPI002FFF6814